MEFSPFLEDKCEHKLHINWVKYLETFENKQDNRITDKKYVCCGLVVKEHTMAHILKAAFRLQVISD